jgi:hypothetical protein
VRELSHEVVQLEAELRSLRAGAGSAHADG